MIEVHPGLHAEIVEIYQSNRDLPADVLLATLNGPARIQQRGFQVTPEHLLAVIIDTWRVNDKTRFILYDIDDDNLAMKRCYKDLGQATEEADDWNDVIVLRTQVP